MRQISKWTLVVVMIAAVACGEDAAKKATEEKDPKGDLLMLLDRHKTELEAFRKEHGAKLSAGQRAAIDGLVKGYEEAITQKDEPSAWRKLHIDLGKIRSFDRSKIGGARLWAPAAANTKALGTALRIELIANRLALLPYKLEGNFRFEGTIIGKDGWLQIAFVADPFIKTPTAKCALGQVPLDRKSHTFTLSREDGVLKLEIDGNVEAMKTPLGEPSGTGFVGFNAVSGDGIAYARSLKLEVKGK